MNSTMKTVVLWLTLIVVGLVLWKMISSSTSGVKVTEINYTEFKSLVEQDKVAKVTIGGNEAHGEYRGDKKNAFHLMIQPSNQEMYKLLDNKNVNVEYKDSQSGNWGVWLIQLSPVLLLGVLWFVMIRQMQTGGNKALSFGKSRARLLSMQQKKLRKSCGRSSSSCAKRRSSRSWVDAFPKAFCW